MSSLAASRPLSRLLPIAASLAGNVYVADGGNNRIEKFDANGAFVSTWGGFGSGDGQFSVTSGVALDADGHVFVSDNFNNRIQEFDSDGNFLAKWGVHGDGPGELSKPNGLSVDAAGALWVADTNNHRIVRFCCPSAHESPAPDGGTPPSDPPPASEPPPASGPGAAPADTSSPLIKVSGRSPQRSRVVRTRGLALRMATSERATVTLRALLSARDARRLGLRSRSVGRSAADLATAGARGLKLPLTARAQRAIAGTGKPRIVVRASAADPAGNRSSASLAITVTR